MKQIVGQISIEDFLKSCTPIIDHCGNCICDKCLFGWSKRCPYGNCYDGKRAKEDPYDKRFPERTPRTSWSNWNKPNEQKYWCRGGVFYSVKQCDRFVKYKGQEIQECIDCNIQVFQDGFVVCPTKERMTCEQCIEEAEGRERELAYGCRYMTENGCEAHIFAQSLLLNDILGGSDEEPCREQCCIGCKRINNCGYRCGGIKHDQQTRRTPADR